MLDINSFVGVVDGNNVGDMIVVDDESVDEDALDV